jgi:hypothetical protein
MYHTENIIIIIIVNNNIVNNNIVNNNIVNNNIVNNNILFIYLSPIKASPALQSVPQSNPSENPR